MTTIRLLETNGDRTRYRIEDDGPLGDGWKARPGRGAYCEFTIYKTSWPCLSSFGGEVWPGAWPELFESGTGNASCGPWTRLTPAGVKAVEAAS